MFASITYRVRRLDAAKTIERVKQDAATAVAMVRGRIHLSMSPVAFPFLVSSDSSSLFAFDFLPILPFGFCFIRLLWNNGYMNGSLIGWPAVSLE